MTDHNFSETQPNQPGVPPAPPVPAKPAPIEPAPPRESISTFFGRWPTRPGKVRTGILLWALGVPIPLVLLFFLIRGCVS